jgi:hypothetical protein
MLEVENQHGFCQKVKWDGIVHAILLRSKPDISGYNFVSEDKDTMQLGVNQYEKGAVIKPHAHLPLPRSIESTAEFLHIDSGSCQLDLYNHNKQKFFETTLEQGDTVLFLTGGHGLEILESTRIIEVKQGPYYGPAKDKEIFAK